MKYKRILLVGIIPDVFGFFMIGLGIGFIFTDVVYGAAVMALGAGIMFLFTWQYRLQWDSLIEKLKELDKI